jgi:hypothetical protein
LDCRIFDESDDQQANNAFLQPSRNRSFPNVGRFYHSILGTRFQNSNAWFGYDKRRRFYHKWRHLFHGHNIHLSTKEIAINGRVFRWREWRRRRLEWYSEVCVQNHLPEDTRIFLPNANRKSCSAVVKKLKKNLL